MSSIFGVFGAFSLVLGVAVLGAGCSGDDGDDGASTGAESSGGTGPADSGTGPGATGGESAGSSDDAGVITNACGTFDTNEPGDSEVPQDPDDPEIIAACTSLCEAAATATNCMTEPSACIDDCKMRSCTICPGTLVPLVECETQMLDATECTCEATGPACTTPAGCSDQQDATGFCGG